MASLAQQLAQLRALPATDPRAAKAKREALTRLEVRMVKRWGRKPRKPEAEPPF